MYCLPFAKVVSLFSCTQFLRKPVPTLCIYLWVIYGCSGLSELWRTVGIISIQIDAVNTSFQSESPLKTSNPASQNVDRCFHHYNMGIYGQPRLRPAQKCSWHCNPRPQGCTRRSGKSRVKVRCGITSIPFHFVPPALQGRSNRAAERVSE